MAGTCLQEALISLQVSIPARPAETAFFFLSATTYKQKCWGEFCISETFWGKNSDGEKFRTGQAFLVYKADQAPLLPADVLRVRQTASSCEKMGAPLESVPGKGRGVRPPPSLSHMHAGNVVVLLHRKLP